MLRRPLLAVLSAPLALVAASAPAAHAGEAACRVDNGVVVVPAQVLGVAGDYILDPATPHTLMGDTQAQGAGYAETALSGQVRIAGLTLEAQPVAVANLDLRTGAFPTPIAGVIGADLLKPYVLDVAFAPCRIGLWPAGKAPRFGRARALPLMTSGETPTVTASVSDGAATLTGPFALAVGGDTAVRLADDLAGAPGAAKPKELYPGGIGRPRLRALSFAGALVENAPAGLIAATPEGPAGEIGAPVLSRYRLRLDLPAGRLWLAPAAASPDAD